MTAPLSIPKLDRPAFFDGQLLGAADLMVVYDYIRELRRLHNRSLHNWGIAAGFAVTGKEGDRVVTVGPGHALDCDGHDLVLAEPRQLVVPAVSSAPGGGSMKFYLSASWLTDAELPFAEERHGICEGSGAVRRVEEPRLRWQNPASQAPAHRWRRGRDIVLATALIEGCVLAKPLSLGERRSALPARQPFIAAGMTAEGGTTWRFFPANGPPTGVETVVDTSTSGFGGTPAYQANVLGTRLLRATPPQLIDGFVGITASSASSFTLQVTLPRNLAVPPYTLNPTAGITPALLDVLRSSLKWYVGWIGIEE